MSEDMKACPLCGESILAIAKKCKHCNSMLEVSEQAAVVQADVISQTDATIAKPAADYEIALLAIPIVATMLVWFWVAGMNLLQSPGNSLQLIMIATILGTAIFAAMEASRLGMVGDKEKGTYSPIAWFFLFTFLWIVAYPAYLFKRKHYGLANRLVAGILIMLIFLGAFFDMNLRIENKKAEIRGDLEQFQKNLKSLPSPYEQPKAEVIQPSSIVEAPKAGTAKPEEYEEFHTLNCKMINGQSNEIETNRFNDLVNSLSAFASMDHQKLLDKASDPSSCK